METSNLNKALKNTGPKRENPGIRAFEVKHKHQRILHIWILPVSLRQVRILLLIHSGHIPQIHGRS
jgi:hypothetical protein